MAQQLNSYMREYDMKSFPLSLRNRQQRSSVKWTWLDDYVEQIASWAMSDAGEAVLFIRECLYMDSILEVNEIFFFVSNKLLITNPN